MLAQVTVADGKQINKGYLHRFPPLITTATLTAQRAMDLYSVCVVVEGLGQFRECLLTTYTATSRVSICKLQHRAAADPA